MSEKKGSKQRWITRAVFTVLTCVALFVLKLLGVAWLRDASPVYIFLPVWLPIIAFWGLLKFIVLIRDAIDALDDIMGSDDDDNDDEEEDTDVPTGPTGFSLRHPINEKPISTVTKVNTYEGRVFFESKLN